jgi:hypothetical protein
VNFDQYNIARRASEAEPGWVFVASGPGQSILIHPDRDSVHRACPQYGSVHRHIPTDAERESAQGYITRWLRNEYEYHCNRKDIAELERMESHE